MVNPFWNPVQCRVRAFWRLLLQGMALYIGILAFGIAIGLAVGLWLFLRSGGRGVGGIDVQALSTVARTNPLFRLVDAGVSLAAILFTVWLAGRVLDRRRFRDFGFHFSRAWWRDLGFGLLLGALLMVLVFAVELALGWVRLRGIFAPGAMGIPFLPGFVGALLMFIVVGISEELWARGYQLRNLAEGLNLPALGPRGALLLAWLLSSVVFGALHSLNPNATVTSTLFLMVAGLLLGLPFILTGELALSIGLHVTWNLFQGNVFGFPVSGTDAGVTVFAIQQSGPVLWTGGAFGPEAGLIGLVATLVGGGLVWLWLRAVRGRVALVADLAVYRPPVPPCVQ